MKNVIISSRRTLVLSMLILLSLSFSGCANLGQVVSVEKQILFNVKGNSQGNFKSGELTLEYSYRLVGENMILTGAVIYPGSVDSLDVRVWFLDRNGSILKQKIIYYSGYRVFRSWGNDLNFQETLVVPPGAVGITFSHSAQPRSSRR